MYTRWIKTLSRGYSLGYQSRNGPSGRVASPRPGRLLPRLGKRRRRPGPGARSSPSLWAAGPRPSLPDGLSPPLEQVAAVGHQTGHPRSLLPPPPIRATGGKGPRAPRPGSGAPRRQAPLGQTGRENRPGGRWPGPIPRFGATRVGPPPRDSLETGSATPARRWRDSRENPRVDVLTFPHLGRPAFGTAHTALLQSEADDLRSGLLSGWRLPCSPPPVKGRKEEVGVA